MTENHAAEGDLILLTCAFPSETSAEDAGLALVRRGFAAAVHVTPTTSHFIWEGKQKLVKEYVLEAKTSLGHFDCVAATIKENHTYVLPGISFTRLAGGTEEYLGWIRSKLAQANDGEDHL